MTALRLSLLGWTNKEIGSVISLSEEGARQITQEFSDLKKVVKMHITLDAPALELPTTPAQIAGERLKQLRNTELDRLLLG
jgi:hypothetical protein